MDQNHEAQDKNTGILGLGGAAVPKGPNDPSASDDAESEEQRRRRRLDGEASANRGTDEQRSGATGIDMGAGGQGTDLSGR